MNGTHIFDGPNQNPILFKRLVRFNWFVLLHLKFSGFSFNYKLFAIYFRSFGMESNQLLGHIKISSFEVKHLFVLIIFINFRQMLIVQDI